MCAEPHDFVPSGSRERGVSKAPLAEGERGYIIYRLPRTYRIGGRACESLQNAIGYLENGDIT